MNFVSTIINAYASIFSNAEDTAKFILASLVFVGIIAYTTITSKKEVE